MSTITSDPSSLGSVIRRYLALKEALGRRFTSERRILQGLDAFMTANNMPELTQDVFELWGHTQEHLKSGVLRYRMRVVRNLCIFRGRTEPSCFVPDLALFPPTHQYIRPYIFTEDDVRRLIAATAGLLTTRVYPLRSQVFRLAMVLLYTTGMRRGELLRMTLGDYDPNARTLLVRASKFHKTRMLPLSDDAVGELEACLAARRRLLHSALTDQAPLIWSGSATIRGYTGVGFGRVFRTLLLRAGIHKPDGRLPRVHDIRHSFATHALVRWYRLGDDIQAKLPFLSAYMGHVSIASTLYYLSFVEPLTSAACDRFASHCGALVTPLRKEGSG